MAASKEELEKLKLKHSATLTAFTRRANDLAFRANALGENENENGWLMEKFQIGALKSQRCRI